VFETGGGGVDGGPVNEDEREEGKGRGGGERMYLEY